VSKYRIEFILSKIGSATLSIAFIILLVSIWLWQPNLLPYQIVFQILFSFLLVFLYFQHNKRYQSQQFCPITLNEKGQWIELTQHQSSWQITQSSRMTRVLLFVHLQSALSQQHKWILIFNDQVTDADYRRLCRAILYQQQGEKP
jgi:hypothetical protein